VLDLCKLLPESSSLLKVNEQDVFEAYAENNTSGAYQIFVVLWPG